MLPFAMLSLSLFGLRQAPAGTQLHIRLTTPVGTYASKPGTPVNAVLIAPVMSRDGATLLPEGSTISGVVKKSYRVGLGLVHETASLDLEFKNITRPDGTVLPIATRVKQVDNSRERVVGNSIQGVRTTGSIAYRACGYIHMLIGWELHAHLAFYVVKTFLIQVPEPEIYYPAGSELTLAMTEPVVSEPRADTTTHLTDEQSEELRTLVSQMPYRATIPSGRPSDLINVMLVGTQEEIASAFRAAGWTETKPPTLRSKIMGIRAVVENHGYGGMPMSSLRVNDAAADMSWQKGLNNIAKRHHVRLWKQHETWDGQEVWLGAATRDVDFAFLRPGHTMTHQIEENIDLERDKIARDLEFTNCTDLLDWWDRPGAPLNAINATGDPMSTDGRLAVIRFHGCSAPHIAATDGEPIPIHGNYFERLVRRQVLSFRSDRYRSNIVWRTYEATRWTVNSIRKHRPAPPEPPEFEEADVTAQSSFFSKLRNSSWFR